MDCRIRTPWLSVISRAVKNGTGKHAISALVDRSLWTNMETRIGAPILYVVLAEDKLSERPNVPFGRGVRSDRVGFAVAAAAPRMRAPTAAKTRVAGSAIMMVAPSGTRLSA
jgi:hypothetical protein